VRAARREIEGHCRDHRHAGRRRTRRTDGARGLGQIGHRLDADGVGSGRGQHGRLAPESFFNDRRIRIAEGLEQHAARSDRRGHVRASAHRGPYHLHAAAVDLVEAILEAVQAQPGWRSAERVGGHDRGAGVQVLAGERVDHLRAFERPRLGGVTRGEAPREQHAAPRAVGDEPAAAQPGEQRLETHALARSARTLAAAPLASPA